MNFITTPFVFPQSFPNPGNNIQFLPVSQVLYLAQPLQHLHNQQYHQQQQQLNQYNQYQQYLQIQKMHYMNIAQKTLPSKSPLFAKLEPQYSHFYFKEEDDLYSVKTEDSLCKVELHEDQLDFVFKKEEDNSENLTQDLRGQIMKMLTFILNRFGRAKEEQIAEQKKLYTYNKVLLKLFNTLTEKYAAAAKCREDMVRFVLRKAMSSLRDSLRLKENLNSKDASVAFCTRYFQLFPEEMIKKESGWENEEDFLNFLLPYKKNSRNRTTNTRFMTEIFSSDIFYQDYVNYLKNFDEIHETDNQRKIEKFVDFLEGCVKRDSFHEIKQYKRLPWSKAWLEATKVIAYELLELNTWKISQSETKRIKTEKIEAGSVKVEGHYQHRRY